MDEKKRFDHKLLWVNFVLACLIVVIHVRNYEPKSEIVYSSIHLINSAISNIGNIAVPCFFSISGFLFYYKFEFNKLLGKLKRRVFSLVIPFFIWNSINYVFYYFVSRVQAFEMEPIVFSPKTFILYVFNSENSPLWFIRTLVVYTLVSPLLVYLWKRKWIAVGMIAALLLSNYVGISTRFISNYYLPLYLLGAYMARYHEKEIINASKRRTIIGCSGMMLVVIISMLFEPLHLSNNWLFTLRVLGVLSLWFFFDAMNIVAPPKWVRNSFVVFLMHSFLVKIAKLLTFYFIPHYWWIPIFELIIFPPIIVLVIVVISEMFRANRFVAPIWRIMIGNR